MQLEGGAAEEWRPITGYPGYEVSDLGNVRSYRWKNKWIEANLRFLETPHALTKIPTVWGTIGVLLYPLGRRPRSHSVASLVLMAFVGPRPEGCIPHHRDNDRTNLALANLYWGSRRKHRSGPVEIRDAAPLTDTQRGRDLLRDQALACVGSPS